MTHSHTPDHAFTSDNDGHTCEFCEATVSNVEMADNPGLTVEGVWDELHPTITVPVHVVEPEPRHNQIVHRDNPRPQPIEHDVTVEVPITDTAAYDAWAANSEPSKRADARPDRRHDQHPDQHHEPNRKPK